MSEILDFTSSLPPPGYDLLTHLAIIVDTIAMNLQKNHLDRKSIQTLLRKYAIRAESDGQLLYVARVNECVDHALSLAESHLELVSWLVNNNYTISSTAVKWYSFERLFPRNQLPLFCLPFKTSQLRHKLKTIEERADITYADLQANNVRGTNILAQRVKYTEFNIYHRYMFHLQRFGTEELQVQGLLRVHRKMIPLRV